jgi:hypothetical protein
MGYAAVGTIAAAAIVGNTTIYPSYPSGVVSSAPLFLFVSHSNAAAAFNGAITVPATFQLILGSSVSNTRSKLYYTKATATISSTVTISVSISTTSTAGNWKASMVRWQDIVTSTTGLITTFSTSGTSSTAYDANLTVTRVPANAMQFVSVTTTGTAAVTSFTGESGGDYVQQVGSTGNLVQQSIQHADIASTAVVGGGGMPVGVATWISLGIAWDTVDTSITANTNYTFGSLIEFADGGPGVGGSLVQAFGSLEEFAQGGPGVGGSLVQAFGSLEAYGNLGIDIQASAQYTLPGLTVVAQMGTEVLGAVTYEFPSFEGNLQFGVENIADFQQGVFGSLSLSAQGLAEYNAILRNETFPSISISGIVEAEYGANLDQAFPSLSFSAYVDAGISTESVARSFVYRGFHRRLRSQERR